MSGVDRGSYTPLKTRRDGRKSHILPNGLRNTNIFGLYFCPFLSISISFHVMCNLGETETVVHLMYQRWYATQVWRGLEEKWGIKMMRSSTLVDWGVMAVCQNLGGMKKEEWVVQSMAIFWNLWRQRNKVVFRRRRGRCGSDAVEFINSNRW